eukprot:jgi/Undpi1/2745/HiC_scaffold_14.g06123.m1
MCDNCDTYRHESGGGKTVEYADHERAKVTAGFRASVGARVSTLDIPSAAFRVKGFMRFVYHRKHMREEVRRQYSRFFDGRSKRHFYSFHRTGEDVLSVVLGAVSRRLLVRMQEGRYFFFYKGKSPLILPITAKWVQPCRSIGGIWVWRPVLSEHVAALRIQNAWRNFFGRKGLKALVRQTYTLEIDPVTGVECYRNILTGQVSAQKPLALGSERWDLDDMLLWTVDEVVLFIRRCGLKRFAPRLRRYNVDGALLMTFDPEDFLLLGQADSVNTKKVLLAIERRPAFRGYNKRKNDLLRRAALRRRHFEDTKSDLVATVLAQAEIIQRWWREVRRLMLRHIWKKTCMTAKAAKDREQKRKESATWWTERLRDYSGLDPSVKLFGRRADILGVRGWGHWDPPGRTWTPAPEEVGALHKSRLMYRRWSKESPRRSADIAQE